jgi:TolA-binding protein
MLIYPQQSRVELVYGFSWGNYLGWLFTGGGLLLLAFFTVRPDSFGLGRTHAVRPALSGKTTLVLVAAFTGVMLVFWLKDPEKIYFRGHDYYGGQQWLKAAQLFDKSIPGRASSARKAEALFWAARSYDLGDQTQQAQPRYEQLIANYPDSYWAPESMFRMIKIHLDEGKTDTAVKLYQRQQQLYPGHRWTVESAGLMAAQRASGN